MTTTAAPQERTPRVLRAGVLGVATTTLVLVIAAAGLADLPAIRSAALGGALVIGFFVFGVVNVGVVARVVPSMALLVALLTYTLQVVLVAVVFVGLQRSDAFDSTLTEGWLAAGLIAGTLTWMTAQILATLYTPIPPWEGPESSEDDPPVSSREVDAA